MKRHWARELLQSTLYAYIIIAYVLMFNIQINQEVYVNKHEQNLLELMVAAAPITIMYLVIKANIEGLKNEKL